MWQYNHTSYLAHYGVKGSKWGYNKGKPNGKAKAAPDAYKPEMKADTFGDEKGFTDKDGRFYAGDYETARQKKYQWDLRVGDLKAKQQFDKQMYQKSTKRHIDDVGKDVKKAGAKIKKSYNKEIENAKKWLKNL